MNNLAIWHPVGVRSFWLPTGGLRFATTTVYLLATRRVASLPFTLESANDKLKNAVAFLAPYSISIFFPLCPFLLASSWTRALSS